MTWTRLNACLRCSQTSFNQGYFNKACFNQGYFNKAWAA
jgi:hypothetical protein